VFLLVFCLGVQFSAGILLACSFLLVFCFLSVFLLVFDWLSVFLVVSCWLSVVRWYFVAFSSLLVCFAAFWVSVGILLAFSFLLVFFWLSVLCWYVAGFRFFRGLPFSLLIVLA